MNSHAHPLGFTSLTWGFIEHIKCIFYHWVRGSMDKGPLLLQEHPQH